MTTRIRFADMDFISEDVHRDDDEILFLGFLFDNFMTSVHWMNQFGLDADYLESHEAYKCLLKNHLTRKEYADMLNHIGIEEDYL